MKKQILVRDKTITVILNEFAIRVVNDTELHGLLAANTEAATSELIKKIRDDYRAFFKSEFGVTDTSIAIEIWGHVYVDKLAHFLKPLAFLSILKKINNKVIFHCKIIDIGEKGHDNNRFVWDALSVTKPLLKLFLPK